MFRVKKLDIFIAKQFGLLFIATFFICQFVLMMQFLWRYVDELIGKGLSLEILAQFFWYMGLMLMPQAFPLAILLSSLIAYGNMGESMELTAIKASGVSLLQSLRSLIVIVVLIACCSFYFQNVIGPNANKSFAQLLISMKQKSPELEIPEGIFYDGIPNCNLYVQKKDLETGMLYGIMIYRITNSYEDAAIILADSGMLQSTAEKKHLLLNLYSGEWFENMRAQDMANAANIPYRRETFSSKRIVLDYDGEFNLTDMAGLSNNATAKSLRQIHHDLDSIREFNDSVGHAYYETAKNSRSYPARLETKDSARAVREAATDKVVFDTLYNRLSNDRKREIIKQALDGVQSAKLDLDMKADYVSRLRRLERNHMIEAINKFTLSLSCIIFFFIGAPLGAIIRKGGLGVPVIISVIVFIIYYIFENSGMRMAREGEWTVRFGKWISTAVLTPVAVFFTYKANNDSVVFNIDLYKNILTQALGLRMKRHIFAKEVIIETPAYADDATQLERLTAEIGEYMAEHQLLKAPNPVKVFFREGDDQTIRRINDELEEIIEDLSNTRDKVVLNEMNSYPILATHAHTRPFQRKWLNIITGLVLPVGLFFYLRMLRFRLRLYRDLKAICQTNEKIIARIAEITARRKDSGTNNK